MCKKVREDLNRLSCLIACLLCALVCTTLGLVIVLLACWIEFH